MQKKYIVISLFWYSICFFYQLKNSEKYFAKIECKSQKYSKSLLSKQSLHSSFTESFIKTNEIVVNILNPMNYLKYLDSKGIQNNIFYSLFLCDVFKDF